MFGELNLPTFNVEISTSAFLFKGEFEPKGDMLIFLNDDRYAVIRLDEAKLYSLANEAKIRGVKQPMIAVSKKEIMAVSILTTEDFEKVTLLASKRPFVMYTSTYAIRGNLHVNSDSRDDDIFDETKTFFAISDASIYPIHTTRQYPTVKVPVLFLNQNQVYAYHPYQPE